MQFTQLTWDKTIQLIHSPIFHTQVIKRIPSFITEIKNFKKKFKKIYMGEFPHYIRRQFFCYANYFTLLQILRLCILYLVFLICFITFQCKYRVYTNMVDRISGCTILGQQVVCLNNLQPLPQVIVTLISMDVSIPLTMLQYHLTNNCTLLVKN